MLLKAIELFSKLDNRVGGAHQVLKRKIKFILRHMWFKNELDRFGDYLSQSNLNELLRIDPAIQVKCTRPYLRRGLSGSQRLKAQIAFYEWFLSVLKPERICELYANKKTLTALNIKGQMTEIELSAAFGLGREGELAVFLKFEEKVLYKATFTILPASEIGISAKGYVMYVGGFQGERNSNEQIKVATRVLERIKPSHLLFHALQGIAQAWGLVGIVATTDNDQVFASYRNTLAKRIKASYDSTWLELGADTNRSNNFWTLPITWSARPENEIESKIRASYRRRNALKENFMDMCRQGAFHLLQPVRHDSQVTADL